LKQAGDYNFNLLTQYLNDPSINVTDMAEVEDINEIDLLNNIRNRYFKNEIFTAVGTTLIVINPFQKLKGVFGEEVLNDYLEASDKLYIVLYCFTLFIYIFSILKHKN